MTPSALETLMTEVSQENDLPCWSLDPDSYYQYQGAGDLFSKSFVFRIVADMPDEYIILVNEQVTTKMQKDYDLIVTLNDKTIFRIGTVEDLNMKLFGGLINEK